MLIRAERPGDVDAIDVVHNDAFADDHGEGPPPEVGLVRLLRAGEAWIPAQSLLAVVDDEIVGHCLCTRAHVNDTPALALGPIGVVSGHRGRGVGSALINTAIDIAGEMGESIIGLLGDNMFYERFGFVTAASVGIEPPDPAWGRYFQVRLLDGRRVSGVFAYPAPFAVVS
ncbi:MAG: N-acetyltransferase [Acidimicrobiia bacterium]